MIPNTAHFIWFGTEFPWIYALAVRSAAIAGGFETVTLHHADDISRSAGFETLRKTENVRLRPLDPIRLLLNAGPEGTRLAALYKRLAAPAAKANMVRAGLLWQEGGVYLDTDTVTIRPFAPLLDAGVFCGFEHIAMPAELSDSLSPIAWGRAGVKLAARDLFRRLPGGWRGFRRIESFYPAEVNNAVFGATAKHPFVEDLLHRMVAMSEERQLVRFALGTHLLQEKTSDYSGNDLVVHPPRRFYPLSPEISEHWFRMGHAARLNEVLYSDTVLVHWYASVRTRKIIPQVDAEYIRRNSQRQLFSALARPLLD